MKSNIFVSDLPESVQEDIIEAVVDFLLESRIYENNDWEFIAAIENAKTSRLCDLSDMIDIRKFL